MRKIKVTIVSNNFSKFTLDKSFHDDYEFFYTTDKAKIEKFVESVIKDYSKSAGRINVHELILTHSLELPDYSFRLYVENSDW